jgi:cytochrome c oxidase subunit 2
LLAAGAIFGVAGCLPSSVTTQGRAIDGLWAWFVGLSVLVGLTVWTLVTLAIVFRRRDGGLPTQIRGDVRIEAVWTVIPIVIVIGLFIGTLGTLDIVNARSPQAGVNVVVTAFRWGWRFDYPDSSVTVVGTAPQSPELVVPVGQPIHIALTAPANDVDHAFFVPQFLFKRDAIPGRTSTFDFTVDSAGTYRGQCAEFCGVYHAQMLFSVRAVTAGDFQAWLAAARASGPPLPPPSLPAIGPGGSTVPTGLPSIAPASTTPSPTPTASGS